MNPQTTLDPPNTSELVQHLERSREEFIAAVDGLNETQAKLRPDSERWSVLECVEHVTGVEERFVGRIQNAQKLDAPRVDKEREGGIMARVTDRSVRIQSPEAAWPTGRFTTLAHALEQFNAGRSRTIQFAQDRGGELYSLIAEHPRLGPLNGVEVLILIAGHARRHAEQIRETRAALEQS